MGKRSTIKFSGLKKQSVFDADHFVNWELLVVGALRGCRVNPGCRLRTQGVATLALGYVLLPLRGDRVYGCVNPGCRLRLCPGLGAGCPFRASTIPTDPGRFFLCHLPVCAIFFHVIRPSTRLILRVWEKSVKFACLKLNQNGTQSKS